MTRLPLTLACGPYDRTDDLRLGEVRPEGIDLVYVPVSSPPELFARMVTRRSFDAAEMSTSLYIQLRTRGNFPFVALPVFPSRMFRHGYVFVNRRAGIRTPGDLAGRRIGVQEYHQTAGVWIRGILGEHYGVDLSDVRWFEGGVNAPRSPDVLDLRPLADLDITFIGADRCLDRLLRDGDVDAYFGARRPDSLRTSDYVVRLFEDHRGEERRYFQRTGVFPIMHTVVMREELVRRHPWIAESLYKAFDESKRRCLERMRFSGALRYTLPWLQDDLDEIDELFGGDPWPYGLEANRTTLQTLVGYLHSQRFLPDPVVVDDLFEPLHLVNE